MRLAFALACALAACARTPEKPEEKREIPRPADEVRLTPEAIARADIRIGMVERRALGGGLAIPAEVQFDPLSTAHVGQLVVGRITRVAVELGQRVRRGQLLGVVASGDATKSCDKHGKL